MDIKIEYEVGGRRYKDPSKAMDALSASIMQSVGEQVAQKLRDVRCPEHQKPPTVTIVGQSGDQVDLEIEGCCEKVISAAKEELD